MKYDPDTVGLDVEGMTLSEEGAYSRCVRHIWRNGPLPVERIRKFCGAQFDAVHACMEERDGLWSFGWLEESRGSAKAWVQQRSEAGKASAAKRTTVERPLNEVRTVVLSPSLSSLEEEWNNWKLHRKEMKKPMTERSEREMMRQMEEIGPERAAAAIRHSIANGWQGLFEPKSGPNGKPVAPKYTQADADAEKRRIRIANGRDPDTGGVYDEECSRELLIFRGVIKA